MADPAGPRRNARDDDVITLRLPRPLVAVLLALVVHAVVGEGLWQVELPRKKEERVDVTIRSQAPPAPVFPPPPPSAPAPTRPPAPSTPRTSPPPQTSPVVPELPPSDVVPATRAVLPVVERAPEPSPSPSPVPSSAWKQGLLDQLAATSPRAPRTPVGRLQPTQASLSRVAHNDPRLHDDETERKLWEDHGPFFRRGIEALRGQWHPDDVLAQRDARDPTKLCGAQKRETRAVAILNRDGDVVDVQMTGSSGCKPLDEEAIAAFLRVARFPHPPAGLFVLPDGTPTTTTRYPVRFIVTFDGGWRMTGY